MGGFLQDVGLGTVERADQSAAARVEAIQQAGVRVVLGRFHGQRTAIAVLCIDEEREPELAQVACARFLRCHVLRATQRRQQVLVSFAVKGRGRKCLHTPRVIRRSGSRW